MTFLDLLIYALATFRLSLMVSREDGPYWLFAKLRRLPPLKSSAREGLACQWCTSVYAGSLAATAFTFRDQYPLLQFWLIYPLALSGAAICIHQQFTTK